MRNLLHKFGRRLMAGLLSALTVVSLCGTTVLAEPVEPGESGFGYIELKVYPLINGKKSESTSHTSSFITSVMYNQNGSIKKEDSCFGFDVEATYYVDGNPSSKTVRLFAKEKDKNITPKDECGSGAGKATAEKSLQMFIDSDKEDTIWYFMATVDGTDIKAVVNVNVKKQGVKISKIHYSTVGMQVRGIDDFTIGKYDYINTQGEEYRPVDVSGGKAISAWADADSTYFNVDLGSDWGGSGSVKGIQNLDELYKYLATEYIPALGRLGKVPGDTIELIGPAYVKCEGNGEAKTYNLKYYQPTDTTGVNTYASWGNVTKRDFVELRFMKLIVPTVLKGTIKVECYDEDNPTKLLKEETITTDEFRYISDSSQFYQTWIEAGATAFASAYMSLFKDIMDPNYIPKYESFKEMASTLVYDPVTKQVITKDADRTSIQTIKKIIQLRNDTMSNLRNDAAVKPFIGVADVKAPEIEGYKVDFGIGEDAYTKNKWGTALLLANDPTVQMMVNQDQPTGVLKLYYKGAGVYYTVKVRINGVIDESLTREYPAQIGDIIEDKDVDTSIVPKDTPINDIENTPLKVTGAPEKDIIIIDCGGNVPYTVMYYLDGVFKEQVGKSGPTGSIVSSVEKRSYPGYEWRKTEPLSITLDRPGQVIRVYYVKQDLTAPAPTADMKLFKDEYKTVITKSKSGYGVWGYFIVDASEFFNKTVTHYYSDTSSCGTVGASITKDKYRSVNVTATATWDDHFQGKSYKVNMVLDHVTPDHKYYFKFPANNTGTNLRYPKAYIPINWPDGQIWSVKCEGTINYEQVRFWDTTGYDSDYHPGDAEKNDPGYTHEWTYDIPHYTYDQKVKKVNSQGNILVHKNMYEDDFTGDRH